MEIQVQGLGYQGLGFRGSVKNKNPQNGLKDETYFRKRQLIDGASKHNEVVL